MREIKFRGFSKELNKWACGYYWSDKPFLDIRHYIKINGSRESIQVVPESVGQFTGVKDKEGKEVFEGDVIKIHELPIKIRKVTFSDGMFKAEGIESITPLAWHGNAIEVIGSVYENPELCSTH